MVRRTVREIFKTNQIDESTHSKVPQNEIEVYWGYDHLFYHPQCSNPGVTTR